MEEPLASLLSNLPHEGDETATSDDARCLSHFKKGHDLYSRLANATQVRCDPFLDLNDAFSRLDAVANWSEFELWANSLLVSTSVDIQELSWKLTDNRPEAIQPYASTWAGGFVTCAYLVPNT